MAALKIFLGAFLGAIIGNGLLTLSLWLSSKVNNWLWVILAILSWLIGGFVAGLITSTPGKGALAGALTAIFNFIIISLLMIVMVFAMTVMFEVIVTIITLGLVTVGDLSAMAIAAIIGIGILLAVIISVISAFPNAFAGFLGGLINNPNRSKKEAYQEYPVR